MNALLLLLEQLLVWVGLRGIEARLARSSRRSLVADVEAELRADMRALRAESARIATGAHLVLGRVGDVLYRIPLDAIMGAHLHMVAQPGVGKSRLFTSIVRQLLTLMWFALTSASIIVIDPKNESIALMMRVVAELLNRMPVERADACVRRIITIRPFVGGYLTPLGLLVRDHSVDLYAQARVTLELLWRTAGAAVGIRQGVAGEMAIAALLANNVALEEAPFLMRDPVAMLALAERVDSARLQGYFLSGDYAKEQRATIQGLIARIEAVLGIRTLAAMLGGTVSTDLRQAYAPGTIVLCGLDGGPLGSSAIADAVGSYIMTRLGWACFDGQPGVARARGTLFIVDELARLATPAVLDIVERMLITSRWLGTSVWTAAQYATAVPELDRLLSANTRFRLFGRTTTRELGGAIDEWVGNGAPRLNPARRDTLSYLSPAELSRDWSNRVARLPPRHFVVGDRLAPFGAHVISSLEEEPMRWADVESSLRDRVERGGFGVPRAELLAASQAREAEAAARLRRAQTETSKGRADAPLPDLASERARRPRRREVP